MKRFNKYLLTVIFLFGIVSISNAQTVRSTFGNPVSGIHNIEEKTDGILYFRPTGGVKFAYENKTTNDTLTVAESGRTFTYSGAAESEFELPAAVVGLSYRFVINTTSSKIVLDPNGTDTIKLLTLSAGDSLISPGAVGDSIELFCSIANEWSVPNINGTWVDHN